MCAVGSSSQAAIGSGAPAGTVLGTSIGGAAIGGGGSAPGGLNILARRGTLLGGGAGPTAGAPTPGLPGSGGGGRKPSVPTAQH